MLVTVESHVCVGNNILFLHSLPLITPQGYDVYTGFPAYIYVMEKIGHLLHCL